MRLSVTTTWIAFLLIGASGAKAGVITFDFEGLGDGTVLTNQLAGLQFTNASVWTAGLSLNEISFPPHSGTNVAADAAGPITIQFDTPILAFSAFFTYSSALTLDAFDSLNQSVGTSTSAFSSNFVASGHPSNEMLQLSFAGGISRITIAGAPNGSSFVLDDLAITTATSTAAPEPSFWFISLVALAFIGVRHRL